MSFLISFWNVLAMMAPWLLVGFLLAGVVSVLLPRELAARIMGRAKGLRGVINAVLVGVPLPICSCGVLPLSTGLRKSGAGKGAVAAFLIATPQTGVDSILATYALMGPVFAVARPLAAFATGLVGGAVVYALTDDADEPKEPERKCGHCRHCHGGEACEIERVGLVARILRTGFVELLGEISRPLAVGLVVSAAVTAFLPAGFIASAFGGNDWLAMPAMALVGFPMYVCSTAAIPIAASLVAKGLSPGAAFVFLVVGPAINAASLATVAKLIGRRAAVAYALVIAAGAVAFGALVNLLPFDIIQGMADAGSHGGPSWTGHLSAAVLMACLAYRAVRHGKTQEGNHC